mmetsp:Transcript_45168/g.125304  ORF Transcript_45168/g.125304 Transcript_45168/m.125304 type:complete len:220 (+) Transcript_45168:3-662(+)
MRYSPGEASHSRSHTARPRHTTLPGPRASQVSSDEERRGSHPEAERREARQQHADQEVEANHVALHDASPEDAAVVVETDDAALARAAVVHESLSRARAPDQAADAVGAVRPRNVVHPLETKGPAQTIFHFDRHGVARLLGALDDARATDEQKQQAYHSDARFREYQDDGDVGERRSCAGGHPDGPSGQRTADHQDDTDAREGLGEVSGVAVGQRRQLV